MLELDHNGKDMRSRDDGHEGPPFTDISSSSSPMSSADGTAAELAAPAATAELDCGGATSLRVSDADSQRLPKSRAFGISQRTSRHVRRRTYHLIWNLVTLGFVLISRTSLSKRIGSGNASFISSLSYSVFW